MKQKTMRTIGQFMGIVLGSFFFAIGYAWFLVPYKIAPGGVGGLSQIFYHLLGVPLGLSMILMNIPLFIISVIFLGKQFGIRSFFGMMVSGLMIELVSLPNLHRLGIIGDLSRYTFTLADGSAIVSMIAPDDIYLAGIAGSVLLGFGLGVIFRFRGSTGGTDIPVALIKQKTGLSIGTGYWIVETLIILTVGLVFKDLKLVIWGYVNLFISARITDLASEGLPYIKGAYVISDKVDEIKELIYDQLQRGVTFFHTRGGYTGNEQRMLFCIVNRRQVALLRDIVRDTDPEAFMILTDVTDVMGYGFKSRNLDLTADDSG
ncbi:MAG: YitT family protein [Candidatus Cloacimonetes bacterium]|nr:YitT family protein [Candidatus Cloacimonadota bacterium]